ncbi:hypothetical protein J5N97_026866 [Dioscorea zingiberensis]|uniref:Uncharacterized protein n=1 Tax=Dioscorea zingiberensis TaxID=325984 RepID=A0A9D5C3X9_9LILI|nr:hypothetical protein J5N97_026866 [Dioscorea zingiberensis]
MSGNVAHYLVANMPHTDDMVPDNVDKVVVVNDDMANTTNEVDDDALRSIHMDDDVDYSVKAVDGINTGIDVSSIYNDMKANVSPIGDDMAEDIVNMVDVVAFVVDDVVADLVEGTSMAHLQNLPILREKGFFLLVFHWPEPVETLFILQTSLIIEDVRPNGGIKKFRSAAYSNCVRKPS